MNKNIIGVVVALLLLFSTINLSTSEKELDGSYIPVLYTGYVTNASTGVGINGLIVNAAVTEADGTVVIGEASSASFTTDNSLGGTPGFFSLQINRDLVVTSGRKVTISVSDGGASDSTIWTSPGYASAEAISAIINVGTLTLAYPLQVTLTVDDVAQCSHEVSFSASASGGSTTTYTYDWDYDNNGTYDTLDGGTSRVYSSPSGTYTCKVRVNNGGAQATDTESYTVNAALSAGLTDWEITCTGHLSVSLYAAGGSPNYTYEIDIDHDGTPEYINITSSTSDSTTFSTQTGWGDSDAFSWSVTDTCRNVVSSTVTTSWSIPDELEVSITSATAKCDGTIDVIASATGGTSPYTYAWDVDGNGYNDGTGASTNLDVGYGYSGTIRVQVTDDCSNTATDDDDSAQTYTELGVDINTPTYSCDRTYVDFEASGTGGTKEYLFEWDVDDNGFNDGTGSTFRYNCGIDRSGTVRVRLTDTTSGCIVTDTELYNTTYTPLSASASWDWNCDGDVVFTITVTGGTGPYDYVIDANGAASGEHEATDTLTTHSWTYLAATWGDSGSYTWSVTDHCADEESGSGTWTVPAVVSVDLAGTIDHCDGTIDLVATSSGGSGNYQYDWDYDSDETYDDLDASASETHDAGFDNSGTVTVRVTDIDCPSNTATDTYEYLVYEELSVSFDVNDPDYECDMTLAKFTATATGGSGTYTYAWTDVDDSTENTASVNGPNTAGTVWVTVTDTNTSCTAEASLDYDTTYAELLVSLDVVVACDGTATITATATGGTPAYSYDWSYDGNGYFSDPGNAATTATVTGYDSTGTISLTVTDNCLSTDSDLATVDIPAQLSVDVAGPVYNHCLGTATYTATATGGTTPYTYDWTVTGTGTVNEVGNVVTISGYGATGTAVDLTVTDDVGCTDTFHAPRYEINAAVTAALAVDVDHCAGEATVTVTPGGGTTPYTYDWDLDGDSTYEITVSALATQTITPGIDSTGTVNVRVNDGNGCTATDSADYVINPAVSVVLTVAYNAPAATFIATAASGDETYTYDWDMDNDSNYEILDGGDRQTLEGYGTAGTVNVRVTDGCTNEATDTADYVIPREPQLVDPPTGLGTLRVATTSGAAYAGQSAYVVSWGAAQNADYYELQESTSPAFTSSKTYVVTGLASRTFSNKPDATFYHRVRATNAGGYTLWSNVLAVEVGMPAVPSTPSMLTATATSDTTVSLVWSDNATSETGYRVYRNGALIATLPADTTTYTDTGLECDMTYLYHVEAYNAVGTSAASNSNDARTDACKPPPTTVPPTTQPPTTEPPTTVPPTTQPPSVTPSENYVLATLESPAYLHAYDAHGRHVGRTADGGIEIEIPGAEYNGPDAHPQIITIYNPETEIQFKLEGYEKGVCTLTVESQKGGQKSAYKFNEMDVQTGSVFVVDGGSSTGLMDLDGDGEFESTLSGVLLLDDGEEGTDYTMYAILALIVILIAIGAVYATRKKE